MKFKWLIKKPKALVEFIDMSLGKDIYQFHGKNKPTKRRNEKKGRGEATQQTHMLERHVPLDSRHQVLPTKLKRNRDKHSTMLMNKLPT